MASVRKPLQIVQAVVVAWNDVVAVCSDAVAAFRMMLGLASAVRSGFDFGSDPLPVFGQPVMPVRGVPSATSAWHRCSLVYADRYGDAWLASSGWVCGVARQV